jgi:hypothetical protein
LSGYPWFRVYGDAIDDDKLSLLSFEDRWHFVAVLCLKSKGILDDGAPHLERRVAVKLGLQIEDASEVKRRLMDVGLIDENWQPLAWGKRQYVSDHSGAARAKRYREKKRNKTVTLRKKEASRDGNGGGV